MPVWLLEHKRSEKVDHREIYERIIVRADPWQKARELAVDLAVPSPPPEKQPGRPDADPYEGSVWAT
jgi:hypothetical protein